MCGSSRCADQVARWAKMNNLTGNVRFRTNIFGKIIPQVEYECQEVKLVNGFPPRPLKKIEYITKTDWRDAKASDVLILGKSVMKL